MNVITNFNKFVQPIINKKYFSEFFIFFIIITLSQFIFSYDEEKIIALCLISFIILFYNNLNQLIYTLLNEKSQTLENEFVDLFKAKFDIMWKLRIYWRLFLDLEDNVVEFFWWVKKNLIQVRLIKISNINLLNKHLVKDVINFILQKNFMIQKNFQKILLNFLTKQIYTNFQFNIFNYLFLLKKSSIKNVNKKHILPLLFSQIYYCKKYKNK